MAEQQLRKAVALMKQGNKSEAQSIVKAVIKQDRENVAAWWLMANLMEDTERKEKAARKVIALNPQHKGANKFLATLNRSSREPQQNIPSSESQPASETTNNIGEYDWSKIDAVDNKMKKKRDSGDNKNAMRLATFLMGGFAVVVVVLAGILLVPPILQGSAESQIETTVVNFFESTLSMDVESINNYICEEYRVSEEDIAVLSGMSDALGQLTFDVSGLNVDVVTLSGDTAEVSLSGELSTTMIIDGMETTTTVNIDEIMGRSANGGEMIYRLQRENGTWLLCDASLES